MANRFDIQLGDDGDIIIENNDVVLGPSDEQHIQDTLNAFPGWWKENPLDGVGIGAYLNSSGQEQILARSAKLNLTSDGYMVATPKVAIDLNTISINPNVTVV